MQIQIHQREMGREAASLLTALMSGQDKVADIVLRPTLIVRKSTMSPA